MIVLLGTDTYQRQPIIDLRIRRAIRKGTRVYVVTPEPSAARPAGGGHDPLYRRADGNGGARAAQHHAQRAVDPRRLRHQTQPTVSHRSGNRWRTRRTLARTAGADVEALRALAREIAQASGAVLLYDEMATREPTGATLPQDVLQLALLTDNFGRPGAGAGPLMEDSNSLGARDMGLLPDQLPGYLPSPMARRWRGRGGRNCPQTAGKDYDAMLDGGVRALYVMGADPARHATPEQLARLEALDFLVVQDLCLTETAKRAAVVLPAVAYTEKDGTFTNTERAVQVVRRRWMSCRGRCPTGRFSAEWRNALGLDWRYGSPVEILAEIGRVVPLYAGVSRRGLGQEGVRWPFSAGEDDANGKPALVGSPLSHLGYGRARCRGRRREAMSQRCRERMGRELMSDFAWAVVAAVVKSIIAIVALLTAFAYMTLIERRVLARFQRRVGPNRAGPFGRLPACRRRAQDGVQRADSCPTRAKSLHLPAGASALRLHRALAFAVIPLGDRNTWGNTPHRARLGAVHRRCQRRHPLHPGHLVAGRLWHRAGGLVVGQPLFAARRAALGGADGLV